jgi:50S ribosomal protein L16 3-hydroxylase
VLRDWLGPVTLDAFRARHLRRAPIASPGTALGSTQILDDAVVDRVLGSTSPSADVLVVARGELLPVSRPRGTDGLRRLMARGIGVCIRHAQRCDEGLARLAASLEADVAGSAQVQLFITPPRSYGFAWHFDDEDVFIAQVRGTKTYYFRDNTVARVPAEPAAFRRFARETSPLCAATLVAGDFLYLPSRWWHMAVASDESWSISVGVMPVRACSTSRRAAQEG